MSSEYLIKLGKDIIPTTSTKIILGNTLKVPPLAIGTWQFGDTSYWGWTPAAVKEAKEAFDLACSNGLTFFDTAEVYGKGESERELGTFRKEYTKEQQDEQVIATKYFPYDNRTQFPDVLLSALKDSLDRLGMVKSDLYQIHAPIHPASIEVVANALADAVEAGLVKAVGVSNYGLDEIKTMHAALKKRGIQLASNQVSFSLIRTIPEKSGLIQLCHDLGISILAYSPMGMGLLTGKFGSKGPWPEARKRLFSSFDPEQLDKLLTTLASLATKYNRPQSAIALNWTIAKGTIPLAGVRTPEHVSQNATALGFLLSQEDIKTLDQFAFEGSTNKEWNHG
ncbi:NADP-dependent oxidoreductase domain-containing protein [Halteromyces radiatus]|uniref:NADP-dependent oxidoreductase domain-containing protein n=1 Tax=Halteromyces radiatus TaxID=101107 RepID=UPI0022211309|nr:NADP-dependent oxidoreductase domain-containing protein [Halteromyces radiatus]KAI8084818.1 NADP-dependent oxidoreductase domain-containing protein [Halteromyces radiatus]